MVEKQTNSNCENVRLFMQIRKEYIYRILRKHIYEITPRRHNIYGTQDVLVVLLM